MLGGPAWQQVFLTDQQRRYRDCADQVHGHDRGGGDHELARVADSRGGRVGVVIPITVWLGATTDARHDSHNQFEAAQP